MQDDLKEIKERIYVDDNIIPLLEALECQNIHESGGIVYAQLPESYDSRNRRAVQVKVNPSLTTNIRNREVKGDIFSLVSFLQFGDVTFEESSKHLYECKVWICETLGYNEYLDPNRKPKEKPKPVENISFLKDVKGKRNKQAQVSVTRNRIRDESILNEYCNVANQWWEDEGISVDTQWLFGVRYDIRTQRIVFPVHDKDGNLIGVKGRYTGDDKYIQENMKYIYVPPYKCNKSIELFNFHRALPHILERKECIIVEGAKTTMLLTQFGYPNCVSIEGDQISAEQIALLKSTGMDVELVFAFDKDKELSWVEKQVEPITRRTVSAIYDSENLLEKKDSPVDRGRDTWYTLYMEHKHNIK